MSSLPQLEAIVLELKNKEAELKRKEAEMAREKEFVADQQLVKAKKIKLNVGGTPYTTTLTTLRTDPSSMLAAMFSGRFPLEQDEDGSYFIDRDGKVFGLILNWLRTGQIPPSLSEEDRFSILLEAEYFQLSKLAEQLKRSHQLKFKEKNIMLASFDTWKERRRANNSSNNNLNPPRPSSTGFNFSNPTSTAENPKELLETWLREEILPRLKEGYEIVPAPSWQKHMEGDLFFLQKK